MISNFYHDNNFIKIIKMKLIKFSSRPNMKYLVHLIVWTFVQDLVQDGIGLYLKFHLDLTFLLIYFLGQFIIGGIIYLYQQKTKKKKSINDDFMGIKLIRNDKIKINDSKFKIYFLIIIAAFFNFIDFLIYTLLTPNLIHCSYSIESRLRGIIIIFDVCFYRYALKLPIFKHQKFSLLILSICLIIILATEYIFQDVDIFLNYGDFTYILFIFILDGFFFSLFDSIEKYLFEYDYLNPFKVLMLEGVFGFCLGIGYSIYISFYVSFKDYYNNTEPSYFAYSIVGLFLFLILSSIHDVFRVMTNKIYSPMASSLSEFCLNPIYIILTLVLAEDFNSKRNRYLYFSINLILTIIMTLCGLVYNEFIILFFWGLEYETHREIVYRAQITDVILELNDINGCEEDEDSN